MTQTRLLRLTIICLTVYLSSSSLLAQSPNVLFIAIDDLRAEIGCYGAKHVKSPNIDRLATQGTLFNRAYCQQAVCNPSRASMLTGLRPNTLGVYDLPTHFREKHPDVVTLPQLFKQNGYHAQCIGKIFHNWRQDKYKGDPASWSVPSVDHYNSHANDKAQVSGELPPDLSDIPKCEIRDVPDNAYFDGRIAEQAVAALNELKDQPFFLAVGFWKPHSHFNAPKRYWDMYNREDIAPAINPNPPKDVPEIALHDSREILRDFKKRPGGKPTASDVLALKHGYYAAISYMDTQVGKVLNELDRLQLRKNTIVVLWSDHGFHLGEHSLWAKTSNFEWDARVPVIIATPEHQSGQRTDAIVELLDIYPTLVDLCGLKTPNPVEGRSLRRILENPKSKIKDWAMTQHTRPAYPPAGKDPEVMGYSIRTARYRYTEWRNFKSGKIEARELYDHETDSNEAINLANDSNQKEVILQLHTKLDLAVFTNW
ncbi:MAG: sulfatase [Pirellulales bacterium]